MAKVLVAKLRRSASVRPSGRADDQFTVMVPRIPVGGVPSTPWIVQ